MKNVTVTGRTTCGKLSSVNNKVELWDDDTLNFDDKLNTTTTDGLGRFKLYGQTREIRNIEPYILIHHNCDNGVETKTCTFTDRYDVPKNSGGKIHNFKEIKLDVAPKNRKKKCKKN